MAHRFHRPSNHCNRRTTVAAAAGHRIHDRRLLPCRDRDLSLSNRRLHRRLGALLGALLAVLQLRVTQREPLLERRVAAKHAPPLVLRETCVAGAVEAALDGACRRSRQQRCAGAHGVLPAGRVVGEVARPIAERSLADDCVAHGLRAYGAHSLCLLRLVVLNVQPPHVMVRRLQGGKRPAGRLQIGLLLEWLSAAEQPQGFARELYALCTRAAQQARKRAEQVCRQRDGTNRSAESVQSTGRRRTRRFGLPVAHRGAGRCP